MISTVAAAPWEAAGGPVREVAHPRSQYAPRDFCRIWLDTDEPYLLSSLTVSSCGSNSVVECQLPKLNVAGSIPVSRSTFHIFSALDNSFRHWIMMPVNLTALISMLTYEYFLCNDCKISLHMVISYVSLKGQTMKRNIQGKYISISTTGEKAKAFLPRRLPPDPPIDWTPKLRSRFDEALLSLGRLDAMSMRLPDISVFLYSYVRKEAVLSSMVEGTQSSITDLMLFEVNEIPGVPIDDVREVSNYVAALEYGLAKLREGFPLSARLLREMHAKLLKMGRGRERQPGEFRRSQNWIGGTRPGNAIFVPPPPEHVKDCMSDLEKFLHDQPTSTPPLLKAAMAHVQFETIHPFLDGNGRLGRLLITLLLCEEKVLSEPMLYLSLYFKTHRKAYYDLLNQVRIDGDWEAWLEYFADAVIATANQALETASGLEKLANSDREQLKELKRAASSALRVHQAMLSHPISNAGSIAEATGLSHVTVNKSLSHLLELGIVEEITGYDRNRIFSYSAYIEILNEGMELPML